MKRLIAGSAALLGVITVPAQAQSLGAIVNSVFGSGYSQSYYAYQPSYNYGYQPSYGYQQSYSYQQPYRYSRSYNGYGYNSYNGYGYQRSYGYPRGRDYKHWRHERRHHRDENGDNRD